VVVLKEDSCVGSTAEGGAHLLDLKPPRFKSDEPQTLVTFLDYVRESMMRKLDGVSDSDARRALVQSGTSLLSLVQHLTAAEVSWFQVRFAGSQAPDPGRAAEEALTVSEHLANYRRAIARDNEIVALAPSLDQLCAADDYADVDLRWVLVHMIEETARHAGHADIIREQLDGVTGR
jgi:uncharacterized damage-inducible protein DinB